MQFEDLDDLESLPVLYYDDLSSQARSCQMLIKLLKIDIDLQPTDSMEDVNFSDTYAWLNSFCRLPTFMDGNVTLCNGHSILIYLCQKYAPKSMPSLCPSDYITRQMLASLLYYEGSILNRCLSNLLTDIFLAKYPNFDVEYHKKKVSSAYNSLNTFLNGHSFMIGSSLTIADISIASTVSALNIIFPINYEKFPKLFEWFQRLRQMDFYKYNDEGIQKLRYLLKNVGRLNFSSTYNDAPEEMSFNFEKVNVEAHKNRVQTKGLSVENYSSNDSENDRLTTSARKYVKNMKEETGFRAYDTYFINVSKCNCCAGQDFLSHNGEQQVLKGVPKEAYQRAEQLNNTENISRIPKYRNNQGPSAYNRELIDSRRDKAHSKKPERSGRKNTKNIVAEMEAHKQSSTSNSEDMNDRTSLEDQEQKIKHNTKLAESKKPSKKQDSDKLRNEDKSQVKRGAKAVQTEDETSENTESSPNPVDGKAVDKTDTTNKSVQELLEKVRKYETILENTDKVLKNNKSIPTKTISDTSSIDSAKEEHTEKNNLPLTCDVPNWTCQQKYQQCDCSKKHRRRSSRVEALEFDKAIPIVLPRFLVAQSENGKRLAAGSNISCSFESQSPTMHVPGSSVKWKLIIEDSDDSVSQASEKMSKSFIFHIQRNS